MPPKNGTEVRPDPRAFPPGLIGDATTVTDFVLKHVSHSNIDVPFLLPEKDFASKGFTHIKAFSEIQLKALVEDQRENLELSA